MINFIKRWNWRFHNKFKKLTTLHVYLRSGQVVVLHDVFNWTIEHVGGKLSRYNFNYLRIQQNLVHLDLNEVVAILEFMP